MGSRIANAFTVALRSLRPQKYVTFLACITGYLVVVPKPGDSLELSRLALFFLSFSVLVYSAIYMLNDIADRQSDMKHPIKARRLVASEAISTRAAVVIAAALILAGLAVAIFVSPLLVFWELGFVAFNVLYTLALKKIPYVELAANAATHPARVLLGGALFGGLGPGVLVTATAVATVYFSGNCLKRHFEMRNGETSLRTVLAHYRPRVLSTLALSALLAMFSLPFLASSGRELGILLFALCAHALMILGYYRIWPGLYRLVEYALTH
jgi:4-hydroxybenzoate polyprenyltransferase